MPIQAQDVDAIVRAIAARLGATVNQVTKDYFLDPFTYMINFVTPNQLAASATATQTFIVQADSAFAICKTTFTLADVANVGIAERQPYGSGLTTGINPVLVTLTDSGSGRSLMDNPVPIDSQYGTGQRPFLWAVPKILDPNSVFQVTAQNLVATAFHIRLAHTGYKVFGNIAGWTNRNK